MLVAITGIAVVAVALIGLTVQAVRGNRTVGVQRAARTIHNAALDNAYYNCIEIQARSLVSPGEPIAFSAPPTLAGLGSLVTLIKGVASWATFADPPSTAGVRLSLRDTSPGSGTCLGTVVVGTFPKADHGSTVRLGSGSSVAGHGPPPAPPL